MNTTSTESKDTAIDKTGRRKPAKRPRSVVVPRQRAKGQTLLIVAMMGVVLVLFVGLGVDVGNLMGKRAKLQSAVDAAALSAAQLLVGTNTNQSVIDKGYQVLEANGVATTTLNMSKTFIKPNFPAAQQVQVHAVQRANTYFMRIIPIWSVVDIEAEATADINSYAEINAKPYGRPGVVNELNLMVWGKNSWRRNGDAYSPYYWPKSDLSNGNPQVPPTPNPLYSEQPYGYLFRIDVPPSYAYSDLVVQIFDADSYNRPGTPIPYATSTPGPCNPNPPYQCTPTPTPNPNVIDMYPSCLNPRAGTCTSDLAQSEPSMKLNAFPDPYDLSNPNSGRPGFWRVDELRTRYDEITGPIVDNGHGTVTKYSLYHFNPRITTAFGDPAGLSDYPSGCTNNCGPIATYTANNLTNPPTDLSWYQPGGFRVHLADFAPEENNGYYFYLYVQGIDGSSENNYDLRVGPPNNQLTTNDDCTNLGAMYSSACYVNRIYYNTAFFGKVDWNTGGATIFAKRALPLNLDTGTQFPMLFTQVSKFAAGQQLSVRHFDQDCNGGCGSVMIYQMQLCGAAYSDTSKDTSFASCGSGCTGWIGANDAWTDGTPAHQNEIITIPADTSQFFVNPSTGERCDSSWLRMYRYPSYNTDTTVWEMPFIRPRLIK